MRQTTRQNYEERILRVLEHLQAHLDEEVDARQLADIACFSKVHFHRFFKGMLGETLGEHVRRLRLERAAMRLLFTGQDVTGIALDAGYETPEAFSRAFRRQFGNPPSLYRKEARARFLGSCPSGVHYLPGAERAGLNLQSREVVMEIEIRMIEPVRVAYMRHVGPYMEVGETWNKLCGWAGEKGLLGPDTAVFGVCYDDPQITPPDKIRYDACLSLSAALEPQGAVGVQDIFGGEWAVHRHQGPYETLQEAYNNLMGTWLPGSGRELRDSPSVEQYLTDPHTTPPEETVTVIYLPLA